MKIWSEKYKNNFPLLAPSLLFIIGIGDQQFHFPSSPHFSSSYFLFVFNYNLLEKYFRVAHA
jgi:hypothetical protein